MRIRAEKVEEEGLTKKIDNVPAKANNCLVVIFRTIFSYINNFLIFWIFSNLEVEMFKKLSIKKMLLITLNW